MLNVLMHAELITTLRDKATCIRAGLKSFPIQVDAQIFTVCRCVERNPIRAGLSQRAEDLAMMANRIYEQHHSCFTVKALRACWTCSSEANWAEKI